MKRTQIYLASPFFNNNELEYYKNKNLLVSVESNGTPDEVYQNILNAIK